MSLNSKTVNQIKELLLRTVRDKLKNYKPETSYMPFHHRLLGRDRYAMFSFVHSLNTTFGMSIWEQIAVIIAEGYGNNAERQYKLFGEVNKETEEVIAEIQFNLRKNEAFANQIEEIDIIRETIQKGEKIKDPDSTVDLFVKIENQENFFDITAAKPNMKEFVALKQKLLRWTALRLSQNKNAIVSTRLAIPYNPYYPEPYERWTLKGLYDLKNGEILVGEDFWNFIAQDNIYNDLLDTFQEAGEKLRSEIDERFSEFK